MPRSTDRSTDRSRTTPRAQRPRAARAAAGAGAGGGGSPAGGGRRRRAAHRAGAAALATATVCAVLAAGAPAAAPAAGAPRSVHALQDAFASAAAEFQVPVGVLMSVSYHQTLWESHGGLPSTTGNYNVMGLTQVDPGDLAVRGGTGRAGPAGPGQELNQSGDPARTARFRPDARVLRDVGAVDTADPRLHTLDTAARLIGRPASELRTDLRQSVRGGAALLARYEKDARGALPADPAGWYPAIARSGQSPDTRGAALFARRVFATIRSGARRTTGDGQRVALRAEPSVHVPGRSAAAPPTAPAGAAATPAPECPAALTCDFVPAAFKQNGPSKTDYGNYDVTNRPADGVRITSIVIHDTEGGYTGSVASFQNPTAHASPHYLIRASDGLVTQMVQTKDTAWHAGNKSVNMHSIGIEHEGYAIKAGSWYSEPQYESSAQLVAYLAGRFGIPPDREHVLGHDEVPGPLDSYVAGMHWDPGPYWDWNHYLDLLGAPTAAGAGTAAGAPRAGQVVRVVPPYTTANQPALTYDGRAQPPHPANFGYLHTAASTASARVGDPYLRGGAAGTGDGPDWSDKVVAGGRYVVAGQSGADWTAIWYGGRKAWFHNPGGRYTVVLDARQVLTAAAGRTSVPVYGRAYPDSAAYAGTAVPVQTDNDKALTKYTVPAGQAYVPAGPAVRGDYFYAQYFDSSAPGDHTLVTGRTAFYLIRFNHRMAWVRAADVRVTESTARKGAPPRAPVR